MRSVEHYISKTFMYILTITASHLKVTKYFFCKNLEDVEERKDMREIIRD